MTGVAELLAALRLPDGAHVDQRVPKKLLLEHGAPTAADKRAINEGIEALHWLATIKPATAGVPAFRDATREYLEIAVLRADWRAGAKLARLTELIHRAIPYPVLLLAEHNGNGVLSLAHKRWAQNETGKTVLDGDALVATAADAGADILAAFLDALALERQPRGSMLALYDGWANCAYALQAAALTGKFVLLDSDARKAARRAALRAIATLRERAAELRHAAEKASQLARQVEINLELQKVQAELTAAQEQL
ncbi:MAG: DUF4391 domain-containing protein [Proteobacteria bacterium]|nr:DUF4391 domain-containing protein [Pseudomonadota bacterium]